MFKTFDTFVGYNSGKTHNNIFCLFITCDSLYTWSPDETNVRADVFNDNFLTISYINIC